MKPIFMLVAALALTAGAAAAQDAMTEAKVRATLESQGYSEVHDVAFEDGIWKADARSADGSDVDLSIDPKTGTVHPDKSVAKLTEDDVRASLSAAGYAKVHDVKFDDGIWNAEADDPNGKAVELKIDPANGEVMGAKTD